MRRTAVQTSVRMIPTGVLALLAGIAIKLKIFGGSGCAAVGFEPHIAAVCPPVVEYSRKFQARAVEELALLPDGSAVAEMLADYAVMRDQARSC